VSNSKRIDELDTEDDHITKLWPESAHFSADNKRYNGERHDTVDGPAAAGWMK
jgi:hypothetical protein